MGLSKKKIVLLFLILSPLLIGQNLSDRPIIVKNEVETKIKIEQIDENNLQRILEDMSSRIKKLEDKITVLEAKVSTLEQGQ